jgi:MATE family multidrug resistance protein
MTAKVEVLGSTRVHRIPGGVAEVAVLAYPAVLQTLSDTLMQVVDSAIVGRLGVTELGAVGFGGIWVWTMLVAFVGAATGVQTFVSQAFGAREHKQCGPWVWQALYTLLPAAFLWVTVIAVAFRPLLHLLGPSPELQALAGSYAYGRLCGGPAIVVAVVLN